MENCDWPLTSAGPHIAFLRVTAAFAGAAASRTSSARASASASARALERFVGGLLGALGVDQAVGGGALLVEQAVVGQGGDLRVGPDQLEGRRQPRGLCLGADAERAVL